MVTYQDGVGGIHFLRDRTGPGLTEHFEALTRRETGKIQYRDGNTTNFERIGHATAWLQ